MRIKAGVDEACDAVRPTLGAVGMTAAIEYLGLDPIECDDGVTILKNIDFRDKYKQMGVQKLRKAAVRTSTEGGDGTATTTVLTQALVEEAFAEVGEDSSKTREVRERLEKGLAKTLELLSAKKRDITEEDIERIATISSLDPEIAKHIAEIIKEVGVSGVVSVEKGAKLGYTKEIVKGARFDRGLISPYFINSPETGESILEDAYVVLVDRKVSMNEQIVPLLNSIGTGTNIFMIADDIDGVALGTLAANALKGIAKIACIRNPYSASLAREFLFDIAALTGATVISEERGMKLPEATKALCGKAEKIVVNKDRTTIIGGKGNEQVLKDRVEALRKALSETTSDLEKEQLSQRLAMLTGGIGVIRVGAYTDTEYNSKRYKFVNAINATQAALQEGILPGGGSALAYVAQEIDDPMFQNALLMPIHQMAVNAGMVDKRSWWDRLLRKPVTAWEAVSDLLCNYADGTGYDFRRKVTVNMFNAGIIDPYKVTRLALESAVAITQSLINIETAIVVEEGQEYGGKGK